MSAALQPQPGSRLRTATKEGLTMSRLADRSPHPYYRSSADKERRLSAGEDAPESLAPSRSASSSRPGSKSRLRAKPAGTSGDSGTEADDERPSYLQSLPSSQYRPRKGWKNPNSPGGPRAPSPLLTPSMLDGERSILSRRGSQRSLQSENPRIQEQEQDELVAKYQRKRKAELVRRLLESLSLGFLGCLCYHNSVIRGRNESLCHVVLIAALYITIPVRAVYHDYIKHARLGLGTLYYRANWDPAPFLYPLALPVFITLSSNSTQDLILVSNFVLTLCSLPSSLIPFRDFNIHWIISLLPLAYGGLLRSIISNDTTNIGHVQQDRMTFYFPLHEALKSCLHYLTTTSLLPAELELMTVGLIDLLLFAKSPQAVILKALLWIGGITLLFLCKPILTWSVSLARVPSWRFKTPPRGIFEGSPLLCALDDWTGGLLSRRAAARGGLDSSDTEQEGLRSRRSRSTERLTGIVRSTTSQGFMRPSRPPSNGFLPTQGDGGNLPLKRRHTLSTIDLLSARLDLVKLQAHGRSQLKALTKKSFRSLTRAQAVTLKWLYAIYAYAAVLLTIAIPLRSYISHRALLGHEPVGWALGYLFGNLQKFRMQVVLWNIERWICLPKNPDGLNMSVGRADHYRENIVGIANTRLIIGGYCLTCITVGLIVVFRLRTVAEVDTRRKVFHFMMVAMFLPTIFVDPAFVALALILVLAIFLLLDLFRASQLPPISKPLTYFLAPYVDGRDHRGPIVISPIFLLIGCAIPLWLSLAAVGRTGDAPFEGWELPTRDMSLISGVVCVGMGDAAASLIGRRYGRRRWTWSGGKSLEGSLAFAVAVVLGLVVGKLWLVWGQWSTTGHESWATFGAKATVAALGASFTEAVLTGGNDNVIVPVILWLLVKGLGI